MTEAPSSSDDVERELVALYGSRAPLPDVGVLHSVHAVRAPDGRLHALRIDADAPKSETDWFVLSLCRARADLVLTSAENLRREPQLSHRLAGPWAGALQAYRRERLGKAAAPSVAILTRRGGLPARHPVWQDGTPKLVLTPPEAAASLERELGGLAEVVAVPALSAQSACRMLAQRGFGLISIEAGPSTASSLYAAEPPSISELWLTRWESAPADAALAGALPEDAQLFHGLHLVGDAERTEHGQRFRFEQWRRLPAGGRLRPLDTPH
jgi:riboflavin biosynthesis pyrimidine reductase